MIRINPKGSPSAINRRAFLKLSAAAVFSGFSGCSRRGPLVDFPIEINDDLLRGHLIYEGLDESFANTDPKRFDTLIVGAGISGLAAAVRLGEDDVVICDIGESAGGSSGAQTYEGLAFSQGAHYELEYPHYYGSEALEFLSNLNVIKFNSWRRVWEFTERRFLIDLDRKNRCLIEGKFRSEVLPDDEDTAKFEKLVQRYAGLLPMPTRMIPEKLHSLNEITFEDFLGRHSLLGSPGLIQGVNYRLTDDYGGGMRDVSALAGLHYYQCRPYDTEVVNVFSPPEGNFHFARKMLDQLSPDQILTSHLVKRIHPENREFRVEVIDLNERRRKTFLAKRIVYAGQKHGLKFVLPEEAGLFSGNRYAPWIVFNFVLDGTVSSEYWQNEMIGHDPHLLGFVNSQAQEQSREHTVLTAYYCLAGEHRTALVDLERNPRFWVERTLRSIALSLKSDITKQVRKCFIKLHGHAMPIPGPGYLLRDGNLGRKYPNLVYAGVDAGRLPLFFEAVDSGIMAANLLSRI
jgi:hypothetical protein